MPIVFKGLTAGQLLGLLEIPEADQNWLLLNNVHMKVYATEIEFKVANITMAVPAKLDHLQALKIGQLGDLAKSKMRSDINMAIKQLKKKLGAAPPPAFAPAVLAAPTKPLFKDEMGGYTASSPAPVIEATPSPAPAGVMALLVKNKPIATAPVPTKDPEPASGLTKEEQAWAPFPAEELMTAPTVPLLLSHRLYQPVRGSSPNSRYFLVGGNKDVRIGARWKGEQLSVRIEAVDFKQHVKRLQECGFTNAHGNYASMHLQVENAVVAAKAMGAILMGLGIKLDTPLPDLMPLHNKGA